MAKSKTKASKAKAGTKKTAASTKKASAKAKAKAKTKAAPVKKKAAPTKKKAAPAKKKVAPTKKATSKTASAKKTPKGAKATPSESAASSVKPVTVYRPDDESPLPTDVDAAWEVEAAKLEIPPVDDAEDTAVVRVIDESDAPRGIALVEKAIATMDTSDASPLAAGEIAALRLPNGKPLPPSLARLLAFDATTFLGEGGQLRFLSFGDMMQQEFDEQTAETYAQFAAMLPGQCLLLEGGSDSRRFMYVGEPDALGEYPVFVVDTDDVPYVCIAYPGLDLYLADGNVLTICDGTYEDCAKDVRYKAALEDQARRNFHGLLSVEMGANVEAVPGVDPDEALAAFWGNG